MTVFKDHAGDARTVRYFPVADLPLVPRSQAHALNGGDADLDASHSEFVEEQWFFACSESLV